MLRGECVEASWPAAHTLTWLQNYHWWWQSFFVGGASACWIFVYSAWYFATRLHIQGPLSSMLFFSYSFLACLVYGLLTGTAGFLTAYVFVQRIFRYDTSLPVRILSLVDDGAAEQKSIRRHASRSFRWVRSSGVARVQVICEKKNSV